MRDFKRRFKPEIVLLMEPTISSEIADEACRKLGKNCWIRIDADGFRGGIWCLWDDVDIEVDLRYAHSSFLHIAVKSAGGVLWELTAIYASPNASKRRQNWAKLDELRIEAPWLIVGDFNCVISNDECSLGIGASSGFQSWIRQNGMVDLRFIGAAHTWTYGVSTKTWRSERLDRALCDDAWRRLLVIIVLFYWSCQRGRRTG